jgi:hypothetical protein
LEIVDENDKVDDDGANSWECNREDVSTSSSASD